MSTSYESAARERAGKAPSTISCFDPATLEPLGEVEVCPPAEVRERVARARAAQQGWARTRFDTRREEILVPN